MWLFAGRPAACGGAGAGHGAYSQQGAVWDDPHGGAALSRSANLPIRIFQFCFGYPHKVLTYVEYKAVPGVFQNIDPPPPSPPGECVPPPPPLVCPPPALKPGGTHSPGGEGGGGSIFWKTPAIGLACYSLISLRVSGSWVMKLNKLIPVLVRRQSCNYCICLGGDLESVLRTFWPLFISLGPTKFHYLMENI